MVSYVCGGVRSVVFVCLPVKLLPLAVGSLFVVEGSPVQPDSLVQAFSFAEMPDVAAALRYVQ
jgi:hypothetical protein